eukprot:scaffold23870_cov63-Phaeocystis_antarctica.AAC.1
MPRRGLQRRSNASPNVVDGRRTPMPSVTEPTSKRLTQLCQAQLCLRQRMRGLRCDSRVAARWAHHGLPLPQVQRRLPLHRRRARRVLVCVPLCRGAGGLPQPKAAAGAAQAAAALPHAGQGVVRPSRGADHAGRVRH